MVGREDLHIRTRVRIRIDDEGHRAAKIVRLNLDIEQLDAFAHVERLEVMADFEEIRRRHYVIVAAEAARAHAGWYRSWRRTYHPKTRDLIDRGLEISDAELAAARAGRAELRQRLERARDERDCDLWISPAAPGPAPRGLDSTGDPVMNLPWSQAGLPTLALPAGEAEGMPIGLQLVAGRDRDEDLMAWGRMVEGSLGTLEERE